ncbi:hypothetical protein BX611_2807 [Lutibacter oceani]|uniref:Sensor of ECF-type sigma factor n=1 Tax=Lutibacter oceani TaxID=1853311 RepID=A0A3D9RJJ7_9FLAO|nr:hypothetical protein [Lutibacter oceani]REE79907.1 hypothetical protein BX611_2807 [Lutibacter oceani]
MKKLLIITTLILLASSSVFAQKMNRQRVKLLKTAFISEAIDLKPSEAEKFWPVFNLYSDQLQNLKFKIERGMFQEIQLAGGIDEISETKAQELLNQFVNLEKDISETKIKMIDELSKIISARQIVKLQKAERDFNKRILQEYGRRNRNGQ